MTKEDTARHLAEAHFALDEGITGIYRLLEPGEQESQRPVKLLEVNPSTPEVGVSPVGFGADPARGIEHASVIVEVSPVEFEMIRRGELSLPHDWSLGDEIVVARQADGASR